MKKYFPYLYFLVSCIALFFIYYPAREGKFTFGFFNGPYTIDHSFTSWTDVFTNKFNDSCRFVYRLFLYFTYKTFQTHANRWLLQSSILQAAILAFSFVLFKKILEKVNISHAFGIALSASLLLFFSPYMCEIVVWGATSHYLLSVLTIIICWLLLIRYVETSSSIYLWLSHLSFLISIYSLEIGIVFPFMISIYLWLWTKKPQVDLRQTLIIVLPQFIIIFSIFLMNRIIMGTWTGVYVVAVHSNMAPNYMSSQFACYILKYLLFLHFFQFSIRDLVYSFVQRPAIGYILCLFLYIIPLLLFILRYKKMSATWRVLLLLYFFICLSLFLFQNMYFMYLFQSQNDRLGYFYSIFFYLFLAYIIIRVFKWAGYMILLIYGIVGFHYMKVEIGNWQKSGNIVQSLIREYRWANCPGKVHILMLGNNINGVGEFISTDDSGCFAIDYEVMTRKECSPLQDYMTMIMSSENDSVTAHVVNDTTLQVDLLNGNWLSYDGLSDEGYKTTDATIFINKQKTSYQITFKNKKPGDVYIYQSGLHWKQVNGF
jgi:hypothetical protein